MSHKQVWHNCHTIQAFIFWKSSIHMCLAKRFCKHALQTFHARVCKSVLEECLKEWCCARVYFKSFRVSCKSVLQAWLRKVFWKSVVQECLSGFVCKRVLANVLKCFEECHTRGFFICVLQLCLAFDPEVVSSKSVLEECLWQVFLLRVLFKSVLHSFLAKKVRFSSNFSVSANIFPGHKVIQEH